ncbi:AraC family transcriptional regulator [uncultured Desulfovibrio sp.]|uniref:AraC family transcriptional regulator n=1 Tax=uncultured Desulfovibrio sp. TaxID=167968 RepID=UPI00263B30F8|nr:AraC family transcriptional regulator [uncultured Desulfovibrio sp.]
MTQTSSARVPLAATLERLAALLCRELPEDGRRAAPGGMFFLVRHDRPSLGGHCFEKPLASLVVQGGKRILLGSREVAIHAGQSMVAAVDLPSATLSMEAPPERPFLSLFFLLDRRILSDLLLELPAGGVGEAAPAGVSVTDATPDYADAMLRLAALLETPDRLAVLAPIFLRELHGLLLLGPHGGVLRALYARGSKNRQIIEAIAYLRRNLTQPLRVEDVAREAHMSVSSLHRHFKGVTGFSPLQFRKKLRLHEALRLMLTENERAATAAAAVGYESVTQFTREYKRMFGEPPHRDIARRRGD